MSRGPTTVGDLKAMLTDLEDDVELAFVSDTMHGTPGLVDLELAEPKIATFNISDL